MLLLNGLNPSTCLWIVKPCMQEYTSCRLATVVCHLFPLLLPNMTINLGACMQISSSVLESDYPMPVKPRKGIPFVDEEEEEEVYCAAPFNMNADIEATPFAEPGEEQGEQQMVAVTKRQHRTWSWTICSGFTSGHRCHSSCSNQQCL